jgi:hypothetical protein
MAGQGRNEPAELPRIAPTLAALRGWTLAEQTARHARQRRACCRGWRRKQGWAGLHALAHGQPAAGPAAGDRRAHAAARAGQLSRRGLAAGAAVLRPPAQPVLAHPVGLWGADLPGMPYAQRLAELRGAAWACGTSTPSCRREGSLDSAIEDAELNDLASLRRRAPGCVAVAHNGGESARAMRITRRRWACRCCGCRPPARPTPAGASSASWRPGARPSQAAGRLAAP